MSLRDLVEHVFERLDISSERIHIDSNLFRPNDINDIYGTNELARVKLDWQYDMTAFDTIDVILDEAMAIRKTPIIVSRM